VEAPLENTRFSSHPFYGIAEFAAEVGDIEATHVAQLDPFELLPEALPRIQLRGIRRERLEVDAAAGPIGQEFLDDVAAMNRGTIPDEDHPARHLPQQMLQKGDHICRVHRMVLAVEVEFALRRDGADGRQMVARVPFPQNRSLAYWGVSAYDTREGIKA
jgi:hypothetical protein